LYICKTNKISSLNQDIGRLWSLNKPRKWDKVSHIG